MRPHRLVLLTLMIVGAVLSTPARAIAPDAQITMNGLGALRVGLTVEEVEVANAGRPVRLEELPGSDCGTAELGKGVFGLFTDGVLAHVAISNPRYRTRKGVHVGHRASVVFDRYQTVTRTHHTYVIGGYYLKVTTASRRRVVFDTDARGRITLIKSGRIPEVDYVEGCL